MRKFMISAALATAALAAAAPASAQPGYGRPGMHQNGVGRGQVMTLIRDLDQAQNRIERSAQRRIISQREAFGLRREAQGIRVRLQLASRNGIGAREFASLRMQVNRLEQRVRIERQDRDGRRG